MLCAKVGSEFGGVGGVMQGPSEICKRWVTYWGLHILGWLMLQLIMN